jgi:TolB-like protein/class 3 adenylate cyclase/Tfp pilus assembly protein PilF
MPDRRLAAVMVTDMVGFTALMEADPDNALQAIDRAHAILKSIVSTHRGQWLEDTGDRSISAFPSAVDAVDCAMQIQAELKSEPDLKLRIGLDSGDILVGERHVYGDTVNVASFIERLADPEGLVITESVYEAVRGRTGVNVVDLGEKVLKNVSGPVRLYALTGSQRRSRFRNLLSSLMARRMPHVAGAYLAAGWAIVEVMEWLADQGILGRQWVYATVAGLVTLLPSILLITYTHGAHGEESVTRAEKIAVPLNLLLVALLVTYVQQNADVEEAFAPISESSVAVLPFINLSDDVSAEYFGRGVSEELINALVRIPGVYVASRTSSFLFDSNDQDPREIARKLRVASILEGSVRKQGNSIRVSAQLIDGRNNYHLWSETYNHEFKDIFQIQEDIARSVAGELIGVLRPDMISAISNARAATVDTYDLYLRGLDYLRQPPTGNSLARARELFLQALDDDPAYAKAHAALCETGLAQYLLDRSPSLIDRAKSDCQQALRLDDESRDVLFAWGELHRYTGNYDESARIFSGLLERQPTARVWVALGQTRVEQGRFDEAEALFQNAISSEPGNWHNRIALADFLYWRGRFEESLEVLEEVVELSPDNARAYLLMGASYDYLGDTHASLQATLKSIELSPTRGAYRDLGLTYSYLGAYEQAAEAFERSVELGPDDYASWGNLAQTYLLIDGKADAAQAAFDRAVELGTASLEQNPRDWITMARVAVYNVMLGAIEQGVTKIETAVAEGSHISDVHFYDAVIHAQLGQEEQALDALERAVRLGFPVRLIAGNPLFTGLFENGRFKSLVEEKRED